MAKQADPDELIIITELLKLPDVGISLSDLTWAKVKVSTDLWLCVRQTNRTLAARDCECSRRSSTSTSNAADTSDSSEQVRFSLSDGEDDSDAQRLSTRTRLRTHKSSKDYAESSIIPDNNTICNYLIKRSKTSDCLLDSITLDSHNVKQHSAHPNNTNGHHSNAMPTVSVPKVTVERGSIDSLSMPDCDLLSSSIPSSVKSNASSSGNTSVCNPFFQSSRSAPIQIASNNQNKAMPIEFDSLNQNRSNGQTNQLVSSSLHPSSSSSFFHVSSPLKQQLPTSPSLIEIKQIRAQNRLMVKSNSFNTISKALTLQPLSNDLNQNNNSHNNNNNNNHHQRNRNNLNATLSLSCSLNTPPKPLVRTSSVQRPSHEASCSSPNSPSFQKLRLQTSKSSHNICSSSSPSSFSSPFPSNSDHNSNRPPCSRCQSVISILNPYDARLRHFVAGRVRCAVLNPSRPLLATSMNQLCSINCIRSGKCIRRVQLPQRIVYLNWLSPIILALITSTRIYHWDLSIQSSLPQALFPLHPRLARNQIISYETDETGRWCALNTVAHDPENNCIEGLTQLAHLQTINGEHQFVIQCLDALCVQFFRSFPEPTQTPLTTTKAAKPAAKATTKSTNAFNNGNDHTQSNLPESSETASTGNPLNANNSNNVANQHTNHHNRQSIRSSMSIDSQIDLDTNSISSSSSSQTSSEQLKVMYSTLPAPSPSPPLSSLSSLPSENTFMLLLRRKGPHSLRLYVQELNSIACLRPAISRSETIRLDAAWNNSNGLQALSPDFVLFAVAATRYGLLYLITKHAQLLICDLHTGTQLLPHQLSIANQPLIAARLDLQSQGVLCICRDGRVLLLEPDLPQLSAYLCQQGGRLAAIGSRLKLFQTASTLDEVTRL